MSILASQRKETNKMEFNELYEISSIRDNATYKVFDKNGNVFIGEILTFFELDDDAFSDEVSENPKTYQNVCFKIVEIIKAKDKKALEKAASIVYSEYDFPIDIKEIIK